MDKFSKIWFISALLTFIVFMIIVVQLFKPVGEVTPKDVMRIEGVVENLEEGPGDDIIITLEKDSHYYYINRGLKHLLDLNRLKKNILNKKVTLYGIKRWTIFTRDKNMGHISKLLVNDTVIYNEINNDEHKKTIE